MVAIGAVLAIAAFGAILTDTREVPVAAFLLAPLGASIIWSWRSTAVVAAVACIGGAIVSVAGDAYEGAALWLRLVFLAVASFAVVALAAEREQRERALAERREILRRSGAQERAIERLTSLQTVVASTAKEVTTADVAGVITSEARKVLDADRAVLYRLVRGRLELVAFHGYRDQSLEPFRVLDLDRALPATDVVRTGRDLIIESREAFRDRYSSVPAPLGELEASALAVPMRAPHELVGVLYLAWFHDHEVAEPEIDLAHALADAGALALRRAVLHDNLRMSEHRYRGLVEATAAIVWRFDAERRVVEPQPAWEAYTGQEWPAYRDDGWIDSIQPEDQERCRAEWNAVVAIGEPIEIDFRLWHAESGEYRFVTARAGPILDRGVVHEWVGTIIDVHDRTEAMLQSLSEARLRSAVVTAIQDGLFVCLPTGQMIDANVAFTRLIGFTREEILEADAPHPWWPDPELHPAERGRVDALYGELRDVIVGESGGGEFEVSLRHKDGYLFPSLISVAAIRNDDGRVAQVVGTVKDITERKAVEDALRSERDYREAIVAALQEGLVVVATDGAILDVNEAWTTMTGFGRAEVVGIRPPYPWWNADRARDPFTGGTPLLTGTTAEYEASIRTATGNLRRVVINRHPLHDPTSGDQLGYVATFRDITRRAAVEARLRVLAALTSRLASANGLEEVGAAGLAEILPALETEFGAMFAVDTDRDSVHLIASSGLQSQIDWHEFPLDFPAPVADAARSGELTMTENRDQYAARWPALAERLQRGPLHATLEVPLVKGDAVVGVLFVGWSHPRSITSDELELLNASGPTMAQALDRARLFEFQRSVASTLQHAMLTAQPVASAELAVAARYVPAVAELEVGGDWYDVVPLDERRVAVAVGDIVGRGITAAAVMGQLRSALSAVARTTDSAVEAVTSLDRFAHRIEGAKATTLLYGIVDPAAGTLRYTSAGHPPALVIDVDGNARFLEDARGWPLAVTDPSRVRPEAVATVAPGSTIVLYTDGLIERRTEHLEAGLARLACAASARVHLPVERMADELLDELVGGERRDDVALVVLRTAHAESVAFTCRVPATPEELVNVRRELRRWLEGQDVPVAVSEDVVLAVGEACSNAVEHAYAGRTGETVVVEAHRTPEQLVLTVRDHGAWRPLVPDARRNRGLRLIAEVMDDLAVSSASDGGTRVEMRRKLATPSSNGN